MPFLPRRRPLRRPLTLVLAAIWSTVAITGCGGPTASSPTTSQAGDGDVTSGGPTSVTDASDTVVDLPAPAQRVVCLDGTCVDALAELGLEPVAAQPIDMVRHEAFFGPESATVAVSGTFFEPNLEDIAAAEPDLVVGGLSVHGELRAALDGIAPLFLQSIPRPDAAVDNLRRLGELTGRDEQAREAEQRYTQVLEAYRPGDRPTTALSMYGGATDDIGIDAADSVIGATIAAYTAYPWPDAGEAGGFLEIGLEEIVGVDPEHIFLLDFGFDPSAPPLQDQLAQDPLWGGLRAVGDANVVVVDNAWWGTTGGTRGQQLVLDTVLPFMYPEEFPEPLGPSS